jgi:uncharacterized protein
MAVQKKRFITDAQIKELKTLTSALQTRREFAQSLGYQFNGQRSLYDVLGYKTELTFSDYQAAYDRGDIAKRIVDAAPISTWRRRPVISNDDDPKNFTPFETAWAQLTQKRRVFHYLERTDRLAGIGEYGALLIGTSDVRKPEDMARPMAKLKGPESVLYLTPCTQESAEILSLNEDPSSERFGLPERYTVLTANENNITKSNKIEVHWSRVIHVAEELRENDIYGTPRLRAVMNRLNDVDKIAGGSAEIFWQAAKRIMVLQAKEGYSAVDEDDSLTTMMDEMIHGLRRVIDIQGYEVKTLDPTDVKPDEAFRVSLALISSATGIPQRILLGSEQGKMASTQDEVNWNGRIADRQLNFAEPVILRAFIDRLVLAGALPRPELDYAVTWPSLFELSDKEKAQIGLLKARSLAQYIGKAGENLGVMQQVVPVEEFRSEFMNLRSLKVENTESKSGGQFDNPKVPVKPKKPKKNDDGEWTDAESESEAIVLHAREMLQRSPVKAQDITLHINMPEPKVNVLVESKPPDIVIHPPAITVNQPDITVTQPDIVVNVAAQEKRTVRFERDEDGFITRQIVEDIKE